MSEEQDCKDFRKQMLRPFCHDFASIIGILSGYSHILYMKADTGQTLDEADISGMFERLFDYRQPSELMITTHIEYIASQSDPCVAQVHDIIEQAYVMYDGDFREWYIQLSKLKALFIETQQLDRVISGQLVHHASKLADFRQLMIDKSNAL